MTRKNTDDTVLIERTLDGDPEAFSPLVEKYHHWGNTQAKTLYTHILGRVKDAEVAKDLCQETWRKAFGTLQRFRGDSAFFSYLYRIAENTCIDYYRKQKHQDILDPLDEIDERSITETHPCPSRALDRAELREQIRTALAELSPNRRRVFLLYYHHELPIKAISARLGRSEGTIKSHLRNARLQLQEMLAPYLKNQDLSTMC